jgi:hypothetical protein
MLQLAMGRFHTDKISKPLKSNKTRKLNMYNKSEKQEISTEFVQGTACKMTARKADVETE